jgi:hypothetical protein
MFDSYCDNSSNQFAQTSDISMSHGLNSNFMVIVVRDHPQHNHSFPVNISSYSSYQFNILPSMKNEITLDIGSQLLYGPEGGGVNCDDSLKILVIPIANVAVPRNRDVLTIVYENESQFIQCSNDKRIYSKIDCSLIHRYYYLTYKLKNCISHHVHYSDTPDSPSPSSLSALNWYLLAIETLYNQLTRTTSTLTTNQQMLGLVMQKMGKMNICGKLWYEILMYSKIEQLKCNEVAQLYFDMKPYVRLSLQTVVAKLNVILKQGVVSSDNTIFLDLLVANDLLDRHCDHLNDELFQNETIYNSLITRLEDFNNEKNENKLIVCASLVAYAIKMKNNTSILQQQQKDDIPLPYPKYLYQYPTWYFQVFYFFLRYYVSDMKINAIILTCFVSISILGTLVLSCFIAYFACIKHCLRLSSRKKRANDNVMSQKAIEMMQVTKVYSHKSV